MICCYYSGLISHNNYIILKGGALIKNNVIIIHQYLLASENYAETNSEYQLESTRSFVEC